MFGDPLHQGVVPFKSSVVAPVPKKAKAIQPNDYRPVALTSVVMKDFERLVLTCLKERTGHLHDPFQFAYQNKRSVEDAVTLRLHHSLQHLETSFPT